MELESKEPLLLKQERAFKKVKHAPHPCSRTSSLHRDCRGLLMQESTTAGLLVSIPLKLLV